MLVEVIQNAQPLEAWKEERSNGQGKLSERIAETLTNLGYSFRYNQVAHRIEVNGQRLDDWLAAEIRMHMRDRDFKSKEAIEDVYTKLARQQSYHPIRDYLDSLKPDGMNHINKLAQRFQGDDTPIVGLDGVERSLFSVYLSRWMIGAVAKVYEGAQNMMLVLAGSQGIGKSHFAQWLCGPLAPYFVSQAINAEDKDSALRLTNHFIWEVDELDGTIRRSDVAALKAFITRRTVVARPAYARHDIESPALASLIGTVNLGGGFLADATGNRRFYVATISAIDWKYTQHDVNQLWAQAVADYKHGVSWNLHSWEKAAQVETNKRHEVSSLLDDWLETDLCFTGSQTTGLTAAEIVTHMRSKGHCLSGTERQQAMSLADALAKRGIHKRKVNNLNTYIGVKERSGYE